MHVNHAEVGPVQKLDARDPCTCRSWMHVTHVPDAHQWSIGKPVFNHTNAHQWSIGKPVLNHTNAYHMVYGKTCIQPSDIL